MPLSEDEKRILNQIEQRLYEQDPASAERISSTTLSRYLARNCKWATVAFVAGLVVLVVGFSSSWFVGVVGFGIMVAAAFVFTRDLRRMGRHGWQQLASGVKDGSVGGVVGDTGRRIRRRFGDGQER